MAAKQTKTDDARVTCAPVFPFRSATSGLLEVCSLVSSRNLARFAHRKETLEFTLDRAQLGHQAYAFPCGTGGREHWRERPCLSCCAACPSTRRWPGVSC